MLSRRAFLGISLLAAPALSLARAQTAPDALADLEQSHGGRLGVCVIDVASGRRLEHRADERFALCSTSKFLAAALILARVDRGEEALDRRIVYAREKLVAYSPATEKRVDEGMTLAELCVAVLTLSDNTAENLMLESFGGPANLTKFARALGDEVTRFDREETLLNEATPGDPRDTTTPAAMAANLRKLVLGDALKPESREQLTAWMVANTTGGKRLRAGIPEGWRVADKTGSGGHASTNDIGVIWPPGRGPLVVAAYFAESSAPDDARAQVLAEVAKLAVGL